MFNKQELIVAITKKDLEEKLLKFGALKKDGISGDAFLDNQGNLIIPAAGFHAKKAIQSVLGEIGIKSDISSKGQADFVLVNPQEFNLVKVQFPMFIAKPQMFDKQELIVAITKKDLEEKLLQYGTLKKDGISGDAFLDNQGNLIIPAAGFHAKKAIQSVLKTIGIDSEISSRGQADFVLVNPQKFNSVQVQFPMFMAKPQVASIPLELTKKTLVIETFGGQSKYLQNHTNLLGLDLPKTLSSVQIQNRTNLFNLNHTKIQDKSIPNPAPVDWELYYNPEPPALNLPTIQQALKNLDIQNIEQAFELTTRSSEFRDSTKRKFDSLRALGKDRLAFGDVKIYLDDVGNALEKPIDVSMIIGCAPNLMLAGGRGPDISSPDDFKLYANSPSEYKKAMSNQIFQMLRLSASKGKNVIVTPFIGGKLFVNALPPQQQVEYQKIIAEAFVDSVKQLVADNKQYQLKELVLCVPDTELFDIARKALSKAPSSLGVVITLTNSGTKAAIAQIAKNDPNAEIVENLAGHDCDLGGGYYKVAQGSRPGPAEEGAFSVSNAPSVFLGKPPSKKIPFTMIDAPSSKNESPIKITLDSKFGFFGANHSPSSSHLNRTQDEPKNAL